MRAEKPVENKDMKIDKVDIYGCKNCGQVWEFFPEDFGNEKDYPTICPHCSMSIWEMIKNTFQNGGFREVIRWLVIRYF